LIISIGKWAAPLCAQRSYVFIQPKEVKEEVGNCLQSNYNFHHHHLSEKRQSSTVRLSLFFLASRQTIRPGICLSLIKLAISIAYSPGYGWMEAKDFEWLIKS
jgi:hypothetical protein